MDLEFDRKHLWHPYTSAISPDIAYPVISASGCKLTFADGRKVIDGMASWWAAIHGYSHPILVEAIQKQAANLSHVMFGGLTHEPAINAGKKLLSLLPAEFSKIFFADSGSVAVEVAMKTAIQCARKTKFLSLKNAYHGDTAGAMSVCDPINGMHSFFGNALPKQFFAETNEKDIREILQKNSKDIAAVIVEPIVQGAGGMKFYSPQLLKKIRELCDEFDVLMIADEIATGFGRTGKMFAIEHADIVPDIICVGKALTGGMLTLSAMICTEKVAQGACKNGMPLMHGPTFMANPLACAAALANLNLLTSWDWQKKVLFIEKYLKENLMPLRENEKVADVRVIGAIGVVEMKEKINVAQFQADCIERGAWLRPFGKLAYIMPPYIIEEEELKTLVEAIAFAAR
ncbi:MAG: adenosylmethionine--8-amino-7-oxononanoate transaminase [Chitinivibrionia bacterium]|nr:adenosylmethionine--8-amino-7-oxononanoate transaminase [Chitinivibrionia bacterium]